MYKMAGVMAQCGGLECMLNRLAGIKDFKQGRHLLTVSWRQQGGTSPLLLEGPLWMGWPLPCNLGGSVVPWTAARQGRPGCCHDPHHFRVLPPVLSSDPLLTKTSVIASLLLFL